MGKLVVPDKWKDGARNANPGGILLLFREHLEESGSHTGPQRTIDRSKKSSRYFRFSWNHDLVQILWERIAGFAKSQLTLSITTAQRVHTRREFVLVVGERYRIRSL